MRIRTRPLGIAALVLALAVGVLGYAQLARTTALVDVYAADNASEMWRVGEADSLAVVVHRDPARCYAPGIGVIATTQAEDEESVFALADSLRSRASTRLSREDRFITVVLEKRKGHRLAVQSTEYMFVWRLGASNTWTLFAQGWPAGATIPTRLDPRKRQRSDSLTRS